jgi:hypothetical protein
VRTSFSLIQPRVLRTVAAAAAGLALAVLSFTAANAAATPAHHIRWDSPALVAKLPAKQRAAVAKMVAQEEKTGRPASVKVKVLRVISTPVTDAVEYSGCNTITVYAGVYAGAADVEVAWMNLSTYYCYNGAGYECPCENSSWEVTYHDTYGPSVGITEAGDATFWSYASNVTGIEFHCYDGGYGLDGSGNACADNYEYDETQFHECFSSYGCLSNAYPWVAEEESFTGGYNYQTGNPYIA